MDSGGSFQALAERTRAMYVINLEMAHEGAGPAEGSPQQTPSPPHHAPRLPPSENNFHHQILQLKKQQQLQQEILLQHFQQQRQQLAAQHAQQMEHHLKIWKQQQELEQAAREAREAQEARDARAAAAEAHDRHERDLRKKDKHEHSANASTGVKQILQEFIMKKQAAASNGTMSSASYRNWSIVKSSSGESITSSNAGVHPYRIAAPLPLNLVPPNSSDFPLRKTASEPNMLKVRLKARVIERRASPLARRPHKQRPKHRNCESGSPRGSPTAAVIREEEESGYQPPRAPPELLFSSPSMPNISLGRPHAPAQPRTQPLPVTVTPLPPVSESARPGPCPAECGVLRLNKRPLGRTHSAPLPLGDPALRSTLPLAPPAHNYLRDQIRKTVLTRAHDAAQLREEEGEVIDLTSRKNNNSNTNGPPTSTQAAPLARALSSPMVGSRSLSTGLAYDALMLKHGCACGAHAPAHPEHGGRLQSVWARLIETGLVQRTERTRPRKATLDELQSVHSEAHVLVFGGKSPGSRGIGVSTAAPARHLVRLACGGLGVDSDTTWSDHHTPQAARMAAGAVLDLAMRVAKGELKNGFAVVRPPGHHAEPSVAMGFCFFNSVAIAARLLHTRLRVQRILIVDWDVHHGNGTQQIFYDDPHVLYISIHRHDDGNFFPGTGAPSECGSGAGLGFNVNVAWSGGLNPPLGDAEYLAAFRSIVMPIAKEYDPEIVLVSCGFDAASGHPPPLGGYHVSAACFANMTRDLMQLANGKVVLSLEGGYELPAMCDCAAACVRALLGDSPPAMSPSEVSRVPAATASATLAHVAALQAEHWPVVKRFVRLSQQSALEAAPSVRAARLGALQTERDAADTTAAMATLSMQQLRSPESSRSVSEEPMDQDEGK